jgi:hypothetical protein
MTDLEFRDKILLSEGRYNISPRSHPVGRGIFVILHACMILVPLFLDLMCVCAVMFGLGFV